MKRELSLLQATAINMIDMVGIGPFLVTSTVAMTLGFGPYAILAWVIGAILSFFDACVWSELGARMPEAGGSYAYLRESYGRHGTGRLMSFLFVWQTTFQAPLVVASGAIGFARYATYLTPLLPWQSKVLSVGLILLLTLMLYRRIGAVGRISVVLWVSVILTLLSVIIAGFTHVDMSVFSQLWSWPDEAPPLQAGVLGAAAIATMYSYLGYYNVSHLGAEVRDPVRTIPRSMFLSIAGIAVLYLAMQFAIYAVLPVKAIGASSFIISTFFEHVAGPTTATLATGLILVVALSSLFSVMLGYTRIPYAAAKDGLFFRVFAREHPIHGFPTVSLLVLAGLGIIFSLTLTLDDSIKSIITMRVFTQFIAQAIGLMVLRKRIRAAAMPWRMWLYPVPVLIAIIGWLWIFVSAKALQQQLAILAPIIGATVFFVFINKRTSHNTSQ